MASGLEVQGVVKHFGDKPVLNDVSFHLAEGRTGVIVGPSGIGKSTLLGIVAGVIRPDAGKVLIDGKLMDDGNRIYVKPVERNIGYVFQDYLLFPHMTVLENISFGLTARRTPKKQIEERVAEVLALVGLEKFRDMKPGQISGGQRQRVALARALVLEPKLLLLDEPLSALDRPSRETMRVELRRIFESLSTTVLYVTHDLDEAFFFGHDIGIMQSGRISFGSKENLIDNMTPTIAEFLGFNLLKAKFLSVDQSAYRFLVDGWTSQVSFPIINNPKLLPDDWVTLAFSPGAVDLNRIGSPDAQPDFEVREIWEFKDRVQVIVGRLGIRMTTEVSSEEFRELNLRRGDVVHIRIREAALAKGHS